MKTHLQIFSPINSFLQSNIVKVLLGISLITAATQISIPYYPVPITLQTVAVLFICLNYSTKNAFQSIAYYIAIGLLGAPVFSNFGFGLAKLLGPSGGYLVGFLICAFAITLVKPYIKTQNSIVKNLALIGIGQTVIYTCGILGLMRFFGFKDALYFGFVPFIIPGIIKSLILAGILDIGNKFSHLWKK